jgi:hypothetical protein
MSEDHVFIWYARKDAAFVNRLTRRLRKLRLATWRDIDALRAGEYWQETIDKALRSATALIVVLSPAAAESQYVAYEWAFALGAGVAVIPIITGKTANTPIHPRLSSIQFVDFTKPGKPWLRLIDALNMGISSVRRQQKPEIRAAFEIKDGKPRKVGHEYVILLSIEGAPAKAKQVTYEVHDPSFKPPRRWSERNPQKDFSSWMQSYGDVLLSADIRTPAGVTSIEGTIYNALRRTHSRDRSQSVRKALHDIERL